MKTLRAPKSWLLSCLYLFIASGPLLTANASYDVFMYATDSTTVIGETLDQEAQRLGAFEVLSFKIGAENTVNIGSISGGGGAGRATFKAMTLTKKVDTASTGFFTHLTNGQHLDEMIIYMRQSGSPSADTFLRYTLKFVMVQDISWSGSDGDDIVEETIVIQYGAMQIDYYKQKLDGSFEPAKTAQWSQVLNEASLEIN